MLHGSEIIISQNRSVFQSISNPKTLAAVWDASIDARFTELFNHIRSFKKTFIDRELVPVSAYAQEMIDNEIDPILNNMGIRFSGYDPLHTWAVEPGDEVSEEVVPHRDHPCIGIFFYFNEHAGLSTFCVPKEYAGEDVDGNNTYPKADLSKAKTFPSGSVALIKLGELTHFSPSEIPAGDCRIVMHARYDY